MVTITTTTESLSAAELLEQASAALSAGFLRPAAVLARAALKIHLRQIYTSRTRTTVPKRFTMKDILGQLGRHRFISRATKKRLTRATDIGHCAAHASPVAWHEVPWMVDTVRAFLQSHPEASDGNDAETYVPPPEW